MAKTSSRQLQSRPSEAALSASAQSALRYDEYESCARVNAWQQVIARRAGTPLQFRW